MPFMTRIPSDLARFGLKVELAPGWATRGSSSFAPACVVNHWTAGPRGTSGRPSLNICVNGRAGLPGPLCNIYLARDGTCIVVAAGRANHAGTGGFRGLVGNSAAYGIEAECASDGDWTPAMLAAYPRLDAALMWGLGRDASWITDHSTWAPSRKIDVRDIKERLRTEAAAILAHPTAAAVQENDMPLTEEDLVKINQYVWNRTPPGIGGAWPGHRLAGIDAKTGDPSVRAELAGLRAAVVALSNAVAADNSNDLTADKLKAAVREAMAEVVRVEVSVDNKQA